MYAYNIKIQKTPYSRSLSKSEKVIEQCDWPRAFWAIIQEPEFSWTCNLYMMVENHLHYHHGKIQKIPSSCFLSEKSNWEI